MATSGERRSHSGSSRASRRAPWNIHSTMGAGTRRATTTTRKPPVRTDGTPWLNTVATITTMAMAAATARTRTAPTRRRASGTSRCSTVMTDRPPWMA